MSTRDPNAIIYSDSDGVLANFMVGASKALGHPFDNAHRKENGDLLNAYEGFWETIPPMHDYRALWGFIEKYHPHILTAVPSAPWSFDFHKVERGKREWYRRHIPTLPQNRIHIVHRDDKSKFATNGHTKNILIDDHVKNVQEFTAAGGVGILHHNAKSTIILLKNLGYH